MAHAYVLLGGNLNDRFLNIRMATQALELLVGSVVDASAIYETEAWGMSGPAFLNQALHLQTDLEPMELLEAILGIEQQLGRNRDAVEGYQNRTMDIDLLLFDDLVLDSPELIVPHPRMAERAFVLKPLAEIAGDVPHPETGITIKTMLNACADPLVVRQWTIPNGDAT